MKNKFKFLLLMILVCLLCACSVQKENGEDGINKEDTSKAEKIVYEDEDVTVKEITVLEKPQFSQYQWEPITCEELVNDSDIIFEGTIKNIKEIAIETEHLDVRSTIYKTVLTIEANDILNNIGNIKEGDTLQTAVCVSSREYTEYVTGFVENQKYLFFMKKTALLEDDPLKISEYCEYYIDSPIQCISPVIDENNYLVDRVLVEDISKENYVKLGDIVFSDEKNAEMIYDEVFAENKDIILQQEKYGENTILAEDITKILKAKKYQNYNTFEMNTNVSYVINKEIMFHRIKE